MLFAGSETQVYFSIDDGDHWQSLRLNMAASSVRDLVIKDDDLVVGTHGRGIWILDNITPLRQIDAKTADTGAVLFKPAPALRVRWDTNPDTPLPPDEPRLPNPPEGAAIDYYLKSAATGPVTIEIVEGDRLVRRYSSADPIPPLPDPLTNASLPLYWYRQPKGLSAAAGMHRFMWDMHYQPLAGGGGGGRGGGGGALPMTAIPFDTAPAPSTPWVNPGDYTVRLMVNGQTYTQPITVKQDPRVKTPAINMQQVYSLTHAMYFGAVDAQKAETQALALRAEIAALAPQAKAEAAKALADLDKKLEALAGSNAGGGAGGGRGGRGARGGGAAMPPAAGAAPPARTAAPSAAAAAPPPAESLSAVASGLSGVMNSLTAADVTPTAVQIKAITAARDAAALTMTQWTAIKTVDLPAINVRLKAAGLAALTLQ